MTYDSVENIPKVLNNVTISARFKELDGLTKTMMESFVQSIDWTYDALLSIALLSKSMKFSSENAAIIITEGRMICCRDRMRILHKILIFFSRFIRPPFSVFCSIHRLDIRCPVVYRLSGNYG